jgi:hypothetical protein
MEWVALSTVGFLAAVGVVIAMGRGTTARWEREGGAGSGRRDAHREDREDWVVR